jgi:hypothetical protein
VTVAAASGAVTGRGAAADSPAPGRPRARLGTATAAPPRAPSTPPLSQPGQPTAETDEAGVGGTPQQEADPLVSNGLGSPICRGALGGEELSSARREDCETSGFVAAGAPTQNFGIDVHIDTGVLGLSSGGLLSTVQDLFVAPPWMALVWAVHALVVMLEWCFAIDLLDSTSASLGAGLRQMQATLTEPWLACVLAVASVFAIYNGLIRRRVSETLGQTLMAGAMMVGGLWVVADPSGSIGALGALANQASLSTLAVSAQGSPVAPGRALADSMAGVFASAIEDPWCYLEFGDVSWCRSPARLDPRLRTAGLAIARRELAQVGCRGETDAGAPCVVAGSQPARVLEHSAQLLRAARSNGAIFLALPADGPQRNSINDESSLLRVMCQSDRATDCHGPMAAQAEFRTNGGTWKRVGGLLLIIAGALGMLLLLGFIAARLLAAAIFSLLYLLLAPVAILAPALGDSGRAAFRKWAAQLVGAVLCKLLFAFLLGVVLAVLAILAGLEALGWWTQWLLMTAFWWGAYVRRHQALSLTGGRAAVDRAGGSWSLRRAGQVLPGPRKLAGAARAIGRRFGGGAPSVEEQRRLERASRQRAFAASDEQVQHGIEHELAEARARAESSSTQQLLSAKRGQLERVQRERSRADASGNRRRVAQLGQRAARIEREIARAQEITKTDRLALAGSERARRESGGDYTREQAVQWAKLLDAQARLPSSLRALGPGALKRDYAALAPVAGFGREEYERLDAPSQRRARLQIDRELSLRSQFQAAAGEVAAGSAEPEQTLRERQRLGEAFDRALERRMRDLGQPLPRSRSDDWVTAWRREQIAHADAERARDSSVMRDAREVASRRKRQLGRERP